MKNTIVKEIFITIILSLVIIITLRMVIFDFIPTEKILPEAIKYESEYTVKNVLRDIENSEKNGEEALLKIYKIESSELTDYVSSGKDNPFTY